jgi:hypothetical protein
LGPWNLGSETRGAAQSLGLFKNMKMWPKVCACKYTRDYLGI